MSEDNKDQLPEKPELKALMVAVKQMVEAGQQEIDVRRGEQDVKREEIASREKIALATIEAQREFHKERFSRFNDHLIHRYWFVGVVMLLVLTFSGFAIWAGAKELIMDLAKLIGGVAVGAFGGFHYGKNKGSKDSDDS